MMTHEDYKKINDQLYDKKIFVKTRSDEKRSKKPEQLDLFDYLKSLD